MFSDITRFINPRSNDFHSDPKEETIMIGLSGNFINIKVNTINPDIVFKELNEIEFLMRIYTRGRESVTDEPYSYSDRCYIIFSFLEILEKYYLYISMHLSLFKSYYDIRGSIKKLINYCKLILKRNDNIPCYCDTIYTPGEDFPIFDLSNTSYLLYDEYCYLEKLCETGEIKNMENYNGYANRRDYRLYKKNFIIVKNRFGKKTDACHDYKQINDELHHWLKYFNQLHRHEMANYKNALRVNTILNENCIDLIIEYMS
jgi:hypothetical protein